jgi:hypothetical protein
MFPYQQPSKYNGNREPLFLLSPFHPLSSIVVNPPPPASPKDFVRVERAGRKK